MITISTIKKVIPASALLLLCVISAKSQPATVSVNIDLSKTYQRIDNFGASDAWSCQFIGKWPGEKKEKIADLFFSRDTLADGSPKGIALSLWRFNIGAGSSARADQSGIKDEWRRAESFLNSDGTYNWQSQAGQMWFLSAAKKRGVDQFLGFVNSPPVNLTINGKAYADSGRSNIAADKYSAFADYLSTVEKGIKKLSGITLAYISPVNEPQWAWSDGGQEGCPYTNSEIAGLVRSIDASFSKKSVPSKVVIAEAGSLAYLFSAVGKSAKGNQINDFFKQGSTNYIGDLKSVKKTILGHSYFTTSPISSAIKTRQLLAQNVNDINELSFWQSEYCILGDNAGEINGNKRDLGIDAALYLAKVIHTDLTAANASAWQWWTAISAYDYKDGLIYVDKNKTDGNYYVSKMLWAMGNYSRFIRPGAIRVDANIMEESPLKSSLLISAFKNGKNFTVVVINNNTENVNIRLNMGNSKLTNTKVFTTSASADLHAEAPADANSAVSVMGRSITTITALIK
ncbi:xylanase [Mucilaginibacter sp. BJC16-A38]|uniref:glycoside hydrolase n=1 Tax=Mucilaginibacter phenanthrenivorans TaxID=1234842 RepID=UPI00215736E0|nr:glycoside hydrolase [Mucilaginibacter phenanthrenivorans]MCR8557766.1 xylanase [Mucilaginibacter phenanthrenivorans]